MVKKFKNDKNNSRASQLNMKKFLERGVKTDESGIWANLYWEYNHRRVYMSPQKLAVYEKLSKKLNRPMLPKTQ